MSTPIHDKVEFASICRSMLAKFSTSFPDEHFYAAALSSLESLLAQRDCCDGKPGGWAGGIVYAIARHGREASPLTFLNSELEAVFGVSMSTIRKRAEQLWPAVLPPAQ